MSYAPEYVFGVLDGFSGSEFDAFADDESDKADENVGFDCILFAVEDWSDC
jgi:hypothetical protein